jgi:hypothetical protein
MDLVNIGMEYAKPVLFFLKKKKVPVSQSDPQFGRKRGLVILIPGKIFGTPFRVALF